MGKFYLLPCLFMFAIQATAQHIEITGPAVDHPKQLVSIRQGDVITIRAPYNLPPKRNVLKNAIRVAGIGAMAYGTEKALTHPADKGPINVSAKNSWLLPVGVGLTLTADQLAGRKKDPGTYITYQFYNRDMALVNTKVVRVTNQQLKKSGGIAVTATALEDGFLHVSSSDNRTYADNDDLNNGLVIAVEPNKAALTEPADLTISPVSTPLATISTTGKNLPAQLTSTGLALVHPSALPVSLAPAIRSVTEPVFSPSPSIEPATSSPLVRATKSASALKSNLLASPKAILLRAVPSESGKESDNGLPEPFNLFLPVDRGIFRLRTFNNKTNPEEPLDGDDDDDDYYGDPGDGGGDGLPGGGGGDDDDDDDNGSGTNPYDPDPTITPDDAETLPPVYVYPPQPQEIDYNDPISASVTYTDSATGMSIYASYTGTVSIIDSTIGSVSGGAVTISPGNQVQVLSDGTQVLVSYSTGNFTCTLASGQGTTQGQVVFTCDITQVVEVIAPDGTTTFTTGTTEASATVSVDVSEMI